MKTLLSATLILILSSCKSDSTGEVYICVSRSAYRYHYSNTCSGLQKCTHTVDYVSKEDAISQGYTECLLEQ